VSPPGDAPVRVRRAPPPFRRVTVRDVVQLTARMTRVTLTGPELKGFAVAEPAASVRLLLPSRGAELVVPDWNGNEFLLPDGRRPVIRTFTPSMREPLALQLDIVTHGPGAASDWARRAHRDDAAAVSGPGRGYSVDDGERDFLIGGDETAIAAIGQLLEALPAAAEARVHIETADASARVDLPTESRAHLTWHELGANALPGDALFDALATEHWTAESRVWIAGEAAGVQRIRKHLFGEGGLSRGQATIRGYWKHGREGGGIE
jgi:NADPH-dependent ferric siderophore reductase